MRRFYCRSTRLRLVRLDSPVKPGNDIPAAMVMCAGPGNPFQDQSLRKSVPPKLNRRRGCETETPHPIPLPLGGEGASRD